MNLRAMREVNAGFGDGLATAFEMVVTPAIFGFFGFLLDRWLGTGPWLMFGLGLFTFGYELWKLAGRYNAEMDGHARNGAWARKPKAMAASEVDAVDGAATPATGEGATSGQERDRDRAGGLDIGSMWVNNERPADA